MGAPTPPTVDLTTNDTRETILTLVNECVDYIADSIEYWLKELASYASDHASEIGGLLGLLGGGLLGGLVGWALGDKIEGKFEKFCNDTWDEFEKFLEDLRTLIGGYFGDPLLISQIASNYRDASRELGPNDGETIATVNTFLKAKWKGEGFDSFIVLSEKQHKALVSMQSTLQDSATLLDDNCTNLLSFWVNTANGLVQLGTNFIQGTGKLGDAGNWVTLGVGVVAETLAACIDDLSNIVTTFANYWINLNVKSAGSWDGLHSKFQDQEFGLPNGQWPDQSRLNSGINAPWQTA
jgi:uncharacterized protein YukE